MKKIVLTLIVGMLFVSTSVFAAALATNTLPSAAGLAVYGGTTAAEAAAASSPLARMSTGSWGIVNFAAAANLSSSYAIGVKHTKGSKLFGTSNDSTNIYWKASPAAATAPYLTVGDLVGTDNTAFGSGWTAY